MEYIYETENLKFADFLHYPDIKIRSERVTFISGESGSGKSTLLKLFNATLEPSSGKIHYFGTDISCITTITLRREVLLVGQSVYLFDKSIKENFEEFYSYRNDSAPSEDEMRNYLNLCKINASLDTLTTSMSGGERQRVFIAIGLSFQPKVLMLDEPTSALDRDNAIHVLDGLKSFCGSHKLTMIVVSHDNVLVDRFAEDIVYINKQITEGA